MTPIYILYHLEIDDVPQRNCLSAEMQADPDIWRNSMSVVHDFDNDLRLQYRHCSLVTNDDIWLYPLDWTYNIESMFSPQSDILDRFMQDTVLLNGLYEGRGYILVHTREAVLDKITINTIEQFFRHKNIPLDRVVHSNGSCRAQAIFAANEYKMQPLIAHFSESLSRDHALADQINWEPRTAVSKRFLCFNRRFRYHRIALLAMLHEARLLDHFKISFGQVVDGSDLRAELESVASNMPDGERYRALILDLYPQLPLLIDSDQFSENLLFQHRPADVAKHYAETGISVVTDTQYYDSAVLHTEKVWHPIRYLQPFILLGPAGTLASLQDRGYRTFNQWFDESYDSIDDDHARLSATVKLISDIASWSDEKFATFMHQAHAVCKHNLAVLTSPDQISYAADWQKLFGDSL
jgi:hypothetical protein